MRGFKTGPWSGHQPCSAASTKFPNMGVSDQPLKQTLGYSTRVSPRLSVLGIFAAELATGKAGKASANLARSFGI